MSAKFIWVDRDRVHASLHALSQPLTVMSLALTLVQTSTQESDRAQALEAVVTECERAMRSVYQLRSLLEASTETGPPPDGRDATTGVRTDWTFGGMA